MDDDPVENERARIFVMNSDGSNKRPFATGIRNPVGIALHPATGELWASVNERDELGDDLVPDYLTRVKEGGFYGWPWFYLGANPDPRHAKNPHRELAEKVIVPDVLLQAHSASLNMVFYTGTQFPAEYRGDAFAALHGSWNRNAPHRLQSHSREAEEWSARRELRRFPHRLRSARQQGVGASGRADGRGRWRIAGERRRQQHDLAGVREEVTGGSGVDQWMETGTPAFTFPARRTMSQLARRTQPWLAERPMASGSLVPCKPMPFLLS